MTQGSGSGGRQAWQAAGSGGRRSSGPWLRGARAAHGKLSGMVLELPGSLFLVGFGPRGPGAEPASRYGSVRNGHSHTGPRGRASVCQLVSLTYLFFRACPLPVSRSACFRFSACEAVFPNFFFFKLNPPERRPGPTPCMARPAIREARTLPFLGSPVSAAHPP